MSTLAKQNNKKKLVISTSGNATYCRKAGIKLYAFILRRTFFEVKKRKA